MADQQKSSSVNGPLALLLLEDGHFFLGRSFGYANRISIDIGIDGPQLAISDRARLCGELCFNTGMAGYQEILSDPSYTGQLICFSFPHIGNVGCNPDDNESSTPCGVYALAMICREYPTDPSNWRSKGGLIPWLEQRRISGICGIDTRALICHLRRNGSMRALVCCLDLESGAETATRPEVLQLLLQQLCNSPQMSGQNLAAKITRAQTELYGGKPLEKWLPLESHSGYHPNDRAVRPQNKPDRDWHVAVLDFGIKENMLRSLQRFAAKVTTLPLHSSWQQIADLQPNGLFLSNGPGDPEPVLQQVAAVLQQAVAVGLPIFGICLGHQLLALSLGAKTQHMHHGHHGTNHPVLNLRRKTVEITSQNHGFCVTDQNLPQDLEVTHRSLFDSSIEGIRSLKYPAFSVQYHPESSPGPHDSMYLFHDFIDLMEKHPNVFSN